MLVARVEDIRVAFPLVDVVEVLPAMATLPLPKAPAVVRGVVNLRGRPLPVLDLRARLGVAPRTADIEDHVVVCRVGDRVAGVWVDRAEGVTALDETRTVPVQQVAQADHVAGVAVVEDGLLLVHDVRSFLDAGEILLLDRALDAHLGDGPDA